MAMEEFRLIVAGGRDFTDYEKAKEEITRLAEGALVNFGVSIVSGMAGGADSLGVHFAREMGIQLYEFPADWQDLEAPGAVIKHDRKGRAYNATAGFKRNADMSRFADGLLAFWDGRSHGTAHMIRTMEERDKAVRVIRY